MATWCISRGCWLLRGSLFGLRCSSVSRKQLLTNSLDAVPCLTPPTWQAMSTKQRSTLRHATSPSTVLDNGIAVHFRQIRLYCRKTSTPSGDDGSSERSSHEGSLDAPSSSVDDERPWPTKIGVGPATARRQRQTTTTQRLVASDGKAKTEEVGETASFPTTDPTDGANTEEVEWKNRILYKDGEYLAINKPYGLPTVGSTETQLSVAKALPLLRLDCSETPRLLHRLSSQISGVLVLARTKQVAVITMQLVEHRSFWKRAYWAVVCGRPQANHGTVRIALGTYSKAKHTTSPVFPMSVSHGGYQAVTEWKLLAYSGGPSARLTKRSGDPFDRKSVQLPYRRWDESLACKSRETAVDNGSIVSQASATEDRESERRKKKKEAPQRIDDGDSRESEGRNNSRSEDAKEKLERVTAEGRGMSLIEFTTTTGRRHQIRAHSAYGLGCPVYGDEVYAKLGNEWCKALHLAVPSTNASPLVCYGSTACDYQRGTKLHLHSREVRFHRINGDDITIRAPIPHHMLNTFKILGWSQFEGDEQDLRAGLVREGHSGGSKTREVQ